MDDKAIYYSSHNKLSFINKDGQDKLEQSKVLVIGAGGLGCPCLLALAGAGIGTMGIADFDSISISNLHRQPLYNFTDAGKLKTTIAAERLHQYNPFIKTVAHQIIVDETNIIDLLSAYDVIADCTDNFLTRYLINDACVYLNKPLVYGAIHQGEGHVTVFNYNTSPTLRCLFPKDENDSIASCAEIGAYNISTSVIGNMMANEVIKIILQQQDVLAGKLRHLNVLDGSNITIGYTNSAEGRTKSLQRFSEPKVSNEISVIAVAQKINERQQFFLLDVREPDEHDSKNIGGSNIPLQTLLQTSHFPFSASDEIIVYCQKGNRSRQAVTYLQEKGFANAVSMQGGIEHFLQLSAQ
jgi:adenylyltransferase/sulfurtransferase